MNFMRKASMRYKNGYNQGLILTSIILSTSFDASSTVKFHLPMSRPASTPLTFTIEKSTPHSGKYVAENILIDKPQDQSSRWSGAFLGSAKQWMLLRLESLAVLSVFPLFSPFRWRSDMTTIESITFGKVGDVHLLHERTSLIYKL